MAVLEVFKERRGGKKGWADYSTNEKLILIQYLHVTFIQQKYYYDVLFFFFLIIKKH